MAVTATVRLKGVRDRRSQGSDTVYYSAWWEDPATGAYYSGFVGEDLAVELQECVGRKVALTLRLDERKGGDGSYRKTCTVLDCAPIGAAA